MDSDIGITIGGPGRITQWNSTSLLVSGIGTIGMAIFIFVMSASIRNNDPNDFFYETDNEAANVFAAFGVIALIIGIILIPLSFKLKDSEERKRQEQMEAQEAARQSNVQEIANALRSSIKIRCRYCGTLNEEAASNCSSCGATL